MRQGSHPLATHVNRFVDSDLCRRLFRCLSLPPLSYLLKTRSFGGLSSCWSNCAVASILRSVAFAATKGLRQQPPTICCVWHCWSLECWFAGLSGQADLMTSTPAIATDLPASTPPIWPFLFITIACGAISGFHCLVSSGTSSKQLSNETDAQAIGYGSMLLEGALAVIVILACCAGVGMGKFERQNCRSEIRRC